MSGNRWSVRTKGWYRGWLFAALLCMGGVASAEVQTIPLFAVRTGPMSGAGVPMGNGFIDYLTLLNERDGGIRGVRLAWEECETLFRADRTLDCYERLKNKSKNAALSVALPFSTEQFHTLLEVSARDGAPLISMSAGRADASDGRVFPYAFIVPINYWSQSTAKIAYIGRRLGGMHRLKGIRIAHLFHDSEFGRETIGTLDRQAARYGFSVNHVAVAPTGADLKEAWEQVKLSNADWVVLRAPGSIVAGALTEAASVGFSRDRIVGTHTTCSEKDVAAAGSAAIGYTCAVWHGMGESFPLVQQILTHVYARHLGAGPRTDLGTSYWVRGVLRALIVTEAMRVAMVRFGSRPLTASEITWGLEHLRLSAESLEALGANGLISPLTLSCRDHEGGGGVKFQQWDGARWAVVSDWIMSDQSLVRPLVEASAADYAKKQHIALRSCE